MSGRIFRRTIPRKQFPKRGAHCKPCLKKSFAGDIASEAHATQGTIYKEIIAAADRVNAEMILIASHRPEMQDYLIGPNAARVVRHARQSVTVLR